VSLAFLYAVLQVLELVMSAVAEGGRRVLVWAFLAVGAAARRVHTEVAPVHEWLRTFLGLVRSERGDGMAVTPA
jgi:hypothetical protein